MARNQYRRRNRHSTFARNPLRTSAGTSAAVLPNDPVGIAIDPDFGTLNMTVGTTYQFGYVFYDSSGNSLSNLTRLITWASSYATVASVTTMGLVSSLGVGTTRVTVTSSQDNFTSGVTIVAVTPVSTPSYISITPTTLVGTSGSTAQVSCVVYDTNSNPMPLQTVVWSGNSDTVFTVGSDITTADPTHLAIVSFLTTSSSTVTLTASN